MRPPALTEKTKELERLLSEVTQLISGGVKQKGIETVVTEIAVTYRVRRAIAGTEEVSHETLRFDVTSYPQEKTSAFDEFRNWSRLGLIEAGYDREGF
ncbi:hypothetical protein [Lysinibacter cavernae]|uniref:hypothetical protein n=1 Tax=Lysinibacter cavernae TaxID=1640652 RepID=UPI0036201CF7